MELNYYKALFIPIAKAKGFLAGFGKNAFQSIVMRYAQV